MVVKMEGAGKELGASGEGKTRAEEDRSHSDKEHVRTIRSSHHDASRLNWL
jgi:hypothetical protein